MDKIYQRSPSKHRRLAIPNRARQSLDDIRTDSHKHLNKHHEGYCAGCWKRTEVMGYILNMCKWCYCDLEKEIVLVAIKPTLGECCDICLRFSSVRQHEYSGVNVNARLCSSCYRRVADNRFKITNKGGIKKVSPLYLEMVKICKDDHIPIRRVGL